MNDDYWAKLHEMYEGKDWITKPSIFAAEAKELFPGKGRLLELGAGLGQDSAYFAEQGYEVTATDLNTDHLKLLDNGNIVVRQVDLRRPLPFVDGSFEVVYAHLSLHYFDQQTTESIFSEIHRVLDDDGILAFFTNSTDDPEHGTGREIEPGFFEIEGTPKRYLDVGAATRFAHQFEPIVADNNGETYKDSAKGIHNLIRFIGKKIA